MYVCIKWSKVWNILSSVLFRRQSVIVKVSLWTALSVEMSLLGIVWQRRQSSLIWRCEYLCSPSYMPFNASEVTRAQPKCSAVQKGRSRPSKNSLLLLYCQKWQWVPRWFLMKNACVFHVFWLNGFTQTVHTNFYIIPPLPTNSQTHTILHFFLSLLFPYLTCSPNLCNLYLLSLPPLLCEPCRSNEVLLKQPVVPDRFPPAPHALFPPTGTGCTVYPRTGTQWREKEGAACWQCQLAWRAAQPSSASSASVSVPPVPLPPCSGTWPWKANLSLSEDKAHDVFVFVCVCVCPDPSISANSSPLSVALCVLPLLVNIPGTAALAAQSHLVCKRSLKGKVLLWDKWPKTFIFMATVPVAFICFLTEFIYFCLLLLLVPRVKFVFYFFE